MLVFFLILLSSSTGDSTYRHSSNNNNKCPVTFKFEEKLQPSKSRLRDACEVETIMRNARLNDAMIVGALANAWHESKWNAAAIGDRGNSIGFWQLNKNGLGKGMGDARFDHKESTRKIIGSINRQKLFEDNPGEAAKTFCKFVMRPSDSARQQLVRKKTAESIEN